MKALADGNGMASNRHDPGRTVGGLSAQRAERVLVIEDEQDVAELIRYTLAKEGYEVRLARNGADGLSQAKESRPDLILLDIMLPQLNGWEVCRRLKRDVNTRDVLVIMVTGRVEEGDKVLGFEMGADDYVTKPFSTRELLARMRAVLRRGRPDEAAGRKAHLKAGVLEIDRHRFEVTMAGRRVDLTLKEFELLCVLVGTPGRAFGREELLDLVWGQDGSWSHEPWTCTWPGCAPSSRRPTFRRRAETVRGVGYRFRPPE